MALDNGRKVLWYLKQVSPFVEDNSSVGTIATSIIANEVDIMEDVCKIEMSVNTVENMARRLKLYQQKDPLNLEVKMKRLHLFLTY